jgi:two-component system, OmpR family, KDP operon response regulator KdpE
VNRILVIDDEPQIRRLLRVALEAAGYRIFEADSGPGGLVEAASRQPDVILLDLGLPGMDGMEVLRRLREWSSTPVLILSVRDGGDDKVRALDLGADDYVTKPFDTSELLARLRVLLRRSQPPDEPVFESGRLSIDFVARVVRVGSHEIDLTATEYNLLRVLARHAGKVVTHKQLLDAVWGKNHTGQAEYLRVFISHIRRKLAHAGFPGAAIRTEAGVGYRLVDEE